MPRDRVCRALRFPGRVCVDVRHVGGRVDRATRVHQEAPGGRRQAQRPVRRVLGVRVAHAARPRRVRRRAAAVRGTRPARAWAQLSVRLLVPELAVTGRAVRAAGRRHRCRQLRVVRLRRQADRRVRRRLAQVRDRRPVSRRQPDLQEPQDLRATVADDGTGVGVWVGRRRCRQRCSVDSVRGTQLVSGHVRVRRVRQQLLEEDYRARVGRVPETTVRVGNADHHHNRRRTAQRVRLKCHDNIIKVTAVE